MVSQYLEKIASDAFDDEIQKLGYDEGGGGGGGGMGGALLGAGLGAGGGYMLAKNRFGNMAAQAGKKAYRKGLMHGGIAGMFGGAAATEGVHRINPKMINKGKDIIGRGVKKINNFLISEATKPIRASDMAKNFHLTGKASANFIRNFMKYAK